MPADLGLWIGFNVIVVFMLVLDLGVFHRHAHEVGIKEAAIWSAIWIGISVSFGAVVYATRGAEAGLQFYSGYLIEKALSVDNIFIFVMIFAYFRVPRRYQHRVLFWGIIGALVMRAAIIFAGAALIQRFDWMMYIFGAFLVLTGIRMGIRKDEEHDLEKNPVIRLARRFLPFTHEYHGQKFTVRQQAMRMGTPLLLVLIFVETTDLLFAMDSIPAVFAVTQDPFIVYTSNVFAILGLRALYFLVAGLVQRLRHLQYGLSIILVFVGVKMLLRDIYHISTQASLVFIISVLVIVVITSLISDRRQAGALTEAPVDKD